jgi:hypothetical protein
MLNGSVSWVSPAVMDSAVFEMASAVLWMEEGRLAEGRECGVKIRLLRYRARLIL